MAIAYQTISTVAPKITTTAGSLVLNEPAGATTDDLFVACISFRGGTIPSVPSPWNIVNRTQVTGNTNTNNAAIGSGLIAWTKRGSVALSAAERTFGGITGEQFPNIAWGYIIRITGQDLTDPVAGTSVNTQATGGSGTITTGGYARSFTTDTANDYIEIMLCMGAQEVTWSTQQYETGPTALTELVDVNTTAGADGSISIAHSTTVGDTTGGFSAVSSALANSGRHSLMVASFGGLAAPPVGYSFSMLF